MFVMKRYQEEAWTPELGASFGDLRLKIKMITPAMKAARGAEHMDSKGDIDLPKMVQGFIEFALSLVIGWQNSDIEYSDQVRDEVLALALEDEVEVLNDKNEPVLLRDYILHFAGDRSNFLASSAAI